MSDSDNQLSLNGSRLRQALRVTGDWLKAFDYTALDYAEDRVRQLEYDLTETRSQLKKLRDAERASV